MATPDMDVIREIPGYKVILKAIIKSQIQQLVEQLANTTDEESVILTASVADGTLCHLGSDSGKVFLEDHEDIKSQFLGFCLKRHHKKKQERERQEALEREEAMARSMQATTPPRYVGMNQGPRYMPQRSPRYPSPQQAVHPVALARASPSSGPQVRSPGVRHQPYPMTRPPRHSLSFDQSQGPGPRPDVSKLKTDGQVIKIEPDDDESNHAESVQTPTDSNIPGSVEPSSPSAKPTTPAHSQGPSASDNEDAKSESSNSTIPNEASDLNISNTGPPGGLSFDSDLSSTMPTPDSHSPQTSVGMDPNVSVKLEAVSEGDMDLEITGVELGQRPSQEPGRSQDWMGGVQGAAGSSGDMSVQQQGYNKFCGMPLASPTYHSRKSRNTVPGVPVVSKEAVNVPTFQDQQVAGTMLKYYTCKFCGKIQPSNWALKIHERIHTGERPFVCHVCNKGFSHKSNMTKHLYTVHGEMSS